MLPGSMQATCIRTLSASPQGSAPYDGLRLVQAQSACHAAPGLRRAGRVALEQHRRGRRGHGFVIGLNFCLFDNFL